MLFLLLIHLALAQPTYSDISAQSKPSYGILSSEGCLINPDSREEWPGTPPILTSQVIITLYRITLPDKSFLKGW